MLNQNAVSPPWGVTCLQHQCIPLSASWIELPPLFLHPMPQKCEVPNHHDYTITRETHDTVHEYKVQGNHNGSQTQTVCIVKDAMYGCHGSECTCGNTQTDGVPCRHIMAIAKSGWGEGLNIVNVMPYWWMTQCWRSQFPKDEVAIAKLTWTIWKRSMSQTKVFATVLT